MDNLALRKHLRCTAYTADSVRGVTPMAINYIFYSQTNGELGLDNYGTKFGIKSNVIL